MPKIPNDKYYTNPDLAEYILNKTISIIGLSNISEIIEPAAGNGVFLPFLKNLNIPFLAYDILPENNDIVKQDYLSLDIDYKPYRLILTNPPFGKKNNLSVKFFKKSIQISDYIGFIQPIVQLNNQYQLYEFDLIHSEDLGIQKYSGIDLHCCFNIWKRSENGFNKRNIENIEGIKFKSVSRSNTGKITKLPLDYDLSICAFGNGSTGKICKYENQYCHQIYVSIDENIRKDKAEIIDLLKEEELRNIKHIASKSLNIHNIIKYLKSKGFQ